MHNHLTYALDKETKRIVGVDDVVNGLACGCLCPDCKKHLVAKNDGSKRKHHFAHYNGLDCVGARMTALHLLAQQIISDRKMVMLPDYNGGYYKKETTCIAFDEILLEEYCDGLRPDCIGIVSGKDGTDHRLWIEIRVTHEVDEQKQKTIRSADVSCIEIDLSDMLNTDYTADSVTQRLLGMKHDRKWVNCPKCNEKNLQYKAHYERIEAERRMKEADKRAHKDEILRQKEALERADRNRVQKWYKDGNVETARYFMAEIKNKPFRKDVNEECFETQNYLYDALVPNNDFLYYVDFSPKNESSLQLFYTLLHYYYNQTIYVDYEKIKQRLRHYQRRSTPLSAEEKIHLEQLISLRIVYILEKGRERYYSFDDEYKTVVKKYVLDSGIRNGVLLVSSVLYHHIIGSSAKTFGELTKEIIQTHTHLAKSYLAIIKSQDKYPNNYYIGNTNMLDELVDFVGYKQIYPNEVVDGILRECYSFAFKQEKLEQYKKNQPQKEDPTEKAWQELNEMYKSVH